MASLATHFSNQNSGIIFSSVETNIGNFFDVMTGRFGAPVSGEIYTSMNEAIKRRKEGGGRERRNDGKMEGKGKVGRKRRKEEEDTREGKGNG